MNPFNKDKVVKAAQEIANHLQMTDHIKALQESQKLLAQSVADLNNRVTGLETELKAIRAETLLASIDKTQSIVNSVQGNLNQRIQDLAIKVAVMEATTPKFPQMDANGAMLIDSKPQDPKSEL